MARDPADREPVSGTQLWIERHALGIVSHRERETPTIVDLPRSFGPDIDRRPHAALQPAFHCGAATFFTSS